MMWFQYILAGFIGACLGSFCSVLVHRIPAGESVITGRSSCCHCKKQLVWYELIPLVSFGLQKACCRSCGSSLSWSYPVREIVMVVLSVLLFHFLEWSIEYMQFVVLAGLLLAVSEIDYRYGIIPNSLVFVGGILGMLMLLFLKPERLVTSILASASAIIFLLFIRYSSKLIFGRIGLGLGDVKLLAVIALFIGWYGIWAFYLATLIGGVVGLLGIALGRFSRASRIPFAPFMAFGVACSAFIFPLDVLTWFLSMNISP